MPGLKKRTPAFAGCLPTLLTSYQCARLAERERVQRLALASF